MTDLPYTYTDFDGDQMIVSPSWITIHDAGVHAPSGDDAVALARAVLAAAGNTGHEVVSAEELGRMRRTAMVPAADHDRLTETSYQRGYEYGWGDGARATRRAAARIVYRQSGPAGKQRISAMPIPPVGGAQSWPEDDTQQSGDTLSDRVAALEALTADQAGLQEKQSRDITTLQTDMRQAQAAIRGLGTGRVAPRPNTEDSL